MAEKIVSPGVFSKEIDASFLPAAVGDIGACVVGPTVKGPALTPTVVNSYGEFQAKFGDVFQSGSNNYQYLTSHTVKNYLQYSGKITVCRIMADGYSHASASIGDTTEDITAVLSDGSITAVQTDPSYYYAGEGRALQIGQKMTIAGGVPTAGDTFTLETSDGHSKTYKWGVGASGTDEGSDVTTVFIAGSDALCGDQLVIALTHANGHLGRVTAVDTDGDVAITHLLFGVPTATVDVNASGFLSVTAGTGGAGTTGNFILKDYNGVNTVTFTFDSSVTTAGSGAGAAYKVGMADLSGTATSLSTIKGRILTAIQLAKSQDDLNITATDGGGAITILKQDTVGVLGDQAIAQTDDADAFTTVGMTNGVDQVDGRGDVAFTLHTLSHGEIVNSLSSTGAKSNNILDSGSANNLRWEVSSKNDNKGTFSLLIRRGDDTIKQKQILETWNNLSLDPSQPNYIDKVIGDQYITMGGTDSDPFLQFNGDYQNKSKYVRVVTTLQTVDYLDGDGNVRVGDASGSLPVVGSGSLGGSFTGGLDGDVIHPIGSYMNENIDGTSTQGLGSGTNGFNNYIKALNLLANADEYDFHLLLLPGIIRDQTDHTAIISKAIDICESRGDAFVIVDTVAYETDAFGTVKTQAKAMNSNYAATYWPWVQTPDLQTGQNVWVPPSVVMAGIYAYNDKVGAPWFAPAGLNRGTLDTVVQAKRRLTHSNRDDLYESNVNPLATFPGQGVVVWGQKTLQKKSSALDRVNVRRLLIKVKKFISASSRFLVFEQNNAQTRERFLNIANPYLEQVQAQSGLNAFKVVMDDTNNTPDIVDRNILYGQIFLQPTKTAEFIILDFTIQPTGAAFPE